MTIWPHTGKAFLQKEEHCLHWTLGKQDQENKVCFYELRVSQTDSQK